MEKPDDKTIASMLSKPEGELGRKEVESLFIVNGFKILKADYKKEPIQRVMGSELADAIIVSAIKES